VPEPSQLNGAPLSALVVDDDPASRLLLCRLLERRGLLVNSCAATDVDDSIVKSETLVVARSEIRALESSGFRKLLKRVRSDNQPPADVESGSGTDDLSDQSLMLAICHDSSFGMALKGGEVDSKSSGEGVAVEGWDETFIGTVDGETLQQCAESVDRWLEKQKAKETQVASAPAMPAAAVALMKSPFELATVERDASDQAVVENGLTWEMARTTAEKGFFGVVVFDAEEEVVYANQRHTDLLGISVVEAGGISAWLAAACPDESYAKKIRNQWRRHIWQKQLTRTFTLKARNEKLREIEFRPRLLADGGLLVMLSDVTEVCRNRDALAVVQAKFSAVFQHMPGGVAMLDRTGRFFDVNPALERMMKCSRLDLLRMTIDECLVESEVQKLRSLEKVTAERDLAAETPKEILRLLAKDGTQLHVEFSVSPAQESPVGGFLRTYFLRDVSDEVALRDRLRVSQEQNRALLEVIPDAVILLDRHGHIEDLALPPAGPLSGDPAAWVGRDLAEVLPGFGGSDFLSVGEVIRSGEAREFSFSQERPEGDAGHASVFSDQIGPMRELHFDVRLVRCGSDHAVAIVRDTTLPVEGDLALRREALVGEHLQDAVIVCSPRGRIEDWNRSAQRVFGYRRHEILGCGLSKLYSMGDPAEFNARLARELNEHGRWSAETQYVHKNGSIQRCEVLFLPVERGGVPVSLVGIHRPLS